MLGLAVVLASGVSAAELRVRVSRNVTGRFQSVGITVTDPLGGLDAKPGPIQVTMADARDRRQSFTLDPVGRPGEWRGRFTPLGTGRYTGTAVLERDDSTDIGLVPLIRVQPSGRPGFIRRHSGSGRLLAFSGGGGGLFPIGVRLDAGDLRGEIDWRGEFTALRSHGVNYLEAPVEWQEELPQADRERMLGAVDTLLLLAERDGHFGVQIRLDPPEDVSGAGAALYQEALQRYIRRWAYSPAVAAWHLATSGKGLPGDSAARLVQAAREADPYHHLIAADGPAPEGRADLTVSPWAPTLPVQPLSLLMTPPGVEEGDLAGGETSWRMLARGGLGLPLEEYRTADPGNGAVLARLQRLAGVARSIPFHKAAVPVQGVYPGLPTLSVCRYGSVTTGWIAPEQERLLVFSRFPQGRHRIRFWDAGSDQPLGERMVWSTGRDLNITLPSEPRAVFFCIEPAGQVKRKA